jgi:hypothetical protein
MVPFQLHIKTTLLNPRHVTVITSCPYPGPVVGALFNASNAKCPPTTGLAMNAPSAKLPNISFSSPKMKGTLTLQSGYYKDQ